MTNQCLTHNQLYSTHCVYCGPPTAKLSWERDHICQAGFDGLCVKCRDPLFESFSSGHSANSAASESPLTGTASPLTGTASPLTGTTATIHWKYRNESNRCPCKGCAG